MNLGKSSAVAAVFLVASTTACIKLGSGASSSGSGAGPSAACVKAQAYCAGDAAASSTCTTNPACTAESEAEVDCLIAKKATCNAAQELDDSLPGCATERAATAACIARNVDAGGDGAPAFPAICQRIKTYCRTTEAKDADCINSVNAAGKCLTQLNAAFNCFMDNKATCNSAGELDDTIPACQQKLAAYVNCQP
ncbi:MAG: hypothetical protein U0174_05735 [Polyangiaceae bacterium]